MLKGGDVTVLKGEVTMTFYYRKLSMQKLVTTMTPSGHHYFSTQLVQESIFSPIRLMYSPRL